MRKDEIELKVQGEPNEIDLDSVARALSAFDKFLKAIPGPGWKIRELRNASSGFAVVADLPTQAERENCVASVQAGILQVRNDARIPEGWADAALDKLLELARLAERDGNEGILVTTGTESIEFGSDIVAEIETLFERNPLSFGSATGEVDRFISRNNRREFGLVEEGQDSPITVTFPVSQMDVVRESIGKKVTVWGMLKRSPTGKKWKLKMERLEVADEVQSSRDTIDGIMGVLGPEWTGGLSSVDWIRAQRGEE